MPPPLGGPEVQVGEGPDGGGRPPAYTVETGGAGVRSGGGTRSWGSVGGSGGGAAERAVAARGAVSWSATGSG
ncbi:MAG: hypothetical protein H6529_19510, partial [Nocardioides sp.]|nr:hypothetical protein [Nocardioides sp.]